MDIALYFQGLEEAYGRPATYSQIVNTVEPIIHDLQAELFKYQQEHNTEEFFQTKSKLILVLIATKAAFEQGSDMSSINFQIIAMTHRSYLTALTPNLEEAVEDLTRFFPKPTLH